MGVLSTITADGKPWGSAIYYVADGSFNFYFVTRVETFKYQNLNKTPFAALTITDSATQTTVQATGEITKVPIMHYMNEFFDKFANIRPNGEDVWSPPLAKLNKGEFMPLCLTPTHLQYADYGHKKSNPHANYIEKIIPS